MKTGSKTQIKKHLKGKTNPLIIDTINLARKNPGWIKVAQYIAGPTRNLISLNLDELNEMSKDGEILVVIGIVLGTGEMKKTNKICALSFSKSAIQKLKKEKIEASFVIDEIKSNPSAKGIRILR